MAALGVDSEFSIWVHPIEDSQGAEGHSRENKGVHSW